MGERGGEESRSRGKTHPALSTVRHCVNDKAKKDLLSFALWSINRQPDVWLQPTEANRS